MAERLKADGEGQPVNFRFEETVYGHEIVHVAKSLAEVKRPRGIHFSRVTGIKKFIKDFGLRDQIRRADVSIPGNNG